MSFKHTWFLAFAGLLYCNFSLAEIEVEDDSFSRINLELAAQRVISLAPNITELIYAAGGEEKLVGVVEGSDYPPEAKDIKTIGAYDKINLEEILELKPDLIIGWHKGNKKIIIKHLKDLDLKVFLLNPRQIKAIPKALIKIGKLLGTELKARQAVDEFNSRLSKIKLSNFGKIPRVFIQIWHEPLISLNRSDLYSDIITYCGGVNIFSKKDFVAPTVNPEEVIKKNPDVIILSTKPKADHPWKSYWENWPELKAVQNNNIFFIDPDLTNRASPRIIDGIKSVCIALGNT